MRARLVIFPIKGRKWCFSKSADPSTVVGSESALPSPTLKHLWKKLDLSTKSIAQNAELVADFVSNKMNRAWINLEKAPVGTVKNKIYGLGLRLLTRVTPSEVFLKSISKEITKVEISYPTSLNPRLVRRRLRHIALRGSVIHRKYFFGSLSLLPFTTALSVLPLPNIPFFWILFRVYSHWLALKGSERLLLLVSDGSKSMDLPVAAGQGKGTIFYDHSKHAVHSSPSLLWVLQPSEVLERLLNCNGNAGDGISESVVSDICKAYDLDKKEVLKSINSL
ncbi:K+-H+ exchange-like protein isoform X1 [Tasmannia lanceolata]|uniref:K+-H+ exchange-like protein isoform X1 n=1 Tax=Tasmannia lanceolata TaxID=3420 RepID=UPI0040634048